MKITRPWNNEDLRRLAEIAAAGGTAVRAAAALKRRVVSCQQKARELGKPFKSVRDARKKMKEKFAAAERDLAAR